MRYNEPALGRYRDSANHRPICQMAKSQYGIPAPKFTWPLTISWWRWNIMLSLMYHSLAIERGSETVVEQRITPGDYSLQPVYTGLATICELVQSPGFCMRKYVPTVFNLSYYHGGNYTIHSTQCEWDILRLTTSSNRISVDNGRFMIL